MSNKTDRFSVSIPRTNLTRKSHFRLPALAVGVLLGSSAILATAATPPQLTTIATGLNNPRGLAFGPNGNLYVAEAGTGAGDGQGGFGVGVGFTGSITEIRGIGSKHSSIRQVVTGLASVGTAERGPEVVGPDGISVHGEGGIYVIMAESAPGVMGEEPDLDPNAAAQLGHLLKVTSSGRWKALADVGTLNYEWTDQHKTESWAPADQFPDANPYGVLAVAGRQYVVDAGANTLNVVRPDGSAQIVAFFPNPLFPAAPDGPGVIPISDSVPTCVAQGPDGWLYVGTLAFGANFARFGQNSPPFWAALPKQSKIYRVNPNSPKFFLDESDVWYAGLNPITGCGFGRDGAFYATEFMTQESGYQSGDVVRIEVNADGSAGAVTALGVGALQNPNGFACGPDGSIYVSNHSVSTGVDAQPGEVVRVNY